MEIQVLHHVTNEWNQNKNTHPSHVIYKGKCNCGQTYIGETARNLKARVNEHSDVNKHSEPAKHIWKQPNHTEVHVGSFNHCPFIVKKENKRSVLHRTLLSRTKQIIAITGPHPVPQGNRYYITGVTWTTRTLSVCRFFHSDDHQRLSSFSP